MTEQEIKNNFTYHTPSADMPKKFETLREKAKELAFLIEELVPNGREKSLAHTKLQEVIMWANAGIIIPKQEEYLPEFVKIPMKPSVLISPNEIQEMIKKQEEKGYDFIGSSFNAEKNTEIFTFRRRK